MGAKYLGSYVGMARPILVERDYQAVKRLLVDRCKGIYLLLEAERLEALIRELTLYEDRSGERDEGELVAIPMRNHKQQLAAPTVVRPALIHAASSARLQRSRPGPGALFILLLQSLTPSESGGEDGPTTTETWLAYE